MKKYMPSNLFDVLANLALMLQGGILTPEDFKRFLERENPFLFLSELFPETIEKFLIHRLKRKIKVDPFPPQFTLPFLTRAAEFGQRPVFFPDIEICQDSKFDNFVMPPEDFYNWIRSGQIAPDSAKLKKGWCLVNFTPAIYSTDKVRVYPDDPFAPIIKRLREEDEIEEYRSSSPLGSRFAITGSEWPKVFAALGLEIEVSPDQINLERCIEYNFLGNVYDPDRGKFNSWESFADLLGDSKRLAGGCCSNGGLAHVESLWVDARIGDLAGRPLVSFV